MAKIVRDVLSGVVTILNDSTLSATGAGTDGLFWTVAELIGYVDDGFRIAAKKSRAWRGKGLIPLMGSPTAAPTFTYSNSTGTFTTGATGYVKYTYVNASGETIASPEAQFTVTAGNNTVVVNCVAIPQGATQVNVYAGALSASELLSGNYTAGSTYNLGSLPASTQPAPPQNTSYTLPADCVEPISFLWGTWTLEEGSVETWDQKYPTWETVISRPSEYARDADGLASITLYPNPDAASVAQYVNLKVRYVKTPPKVAALTDSLSGLPDHYYTALMYYALYRAYLKDTEQRNDSVADEYMARFVDVVGPLEDDATNRFQRTQRRSKPVYR